MVINSCDEESVDSDESGCLDTVKLGKQIRDLRFENTDAKQTKLTRTQFNLLKPQLEKSVTILPKERYQLKIPDDATDELK